MDDSKNASKKIIKTVKLQLTFHNIYYLAYRLRNRTDQDPVSDPSADGSLSDWNWI